MTGDELAQEISVELEALQATVGELLGLVSDAALQVWVLA